MVSDDIADHRRWLGFGMVKPGENSWAAAFTLGALGCNREENDGMTERGYRTVVRVEQNSPNRDERRRECSSRLVGCRRELHDQFVFASPSVNISAVILSLSLKCEHGYCMNSPVADLSV